jgi:hypothetical protein
MTMNDAHDRERRLRQTELELELARIDLEWERERPKYVDRNPLSGREVVPTKAKAVVAGAGLATIAVAYAFAQMVIHPKAGLVEGVVIALVFLVLLSYFLFTGISMYSKAVDYQRAEAAYQQRREEVKARYERKDEGQPDQSSPPYG